MKVQDGGMLLAQPIIDLVRHFRGPAFSPKPTNITDAHALKHIRTKLCFAQV